MAKKKMSNTKRRFRIGNVIVFAFICFLLVQFGQQYVKYYDLKQEAQQYQQVKDQQLAKNEALKKEKELLSDTSYIESVARETLGLVKKGEVLVVPAKEDAQVGQSKVDANKDIH